MGHVRARSIPMNVTVIISLSRLSVDDMRACTAGMGAESGGGGGGGGWTRPAVEKSAGTSPQKLGYFCIFS